MVDLNQCGFATRQIHVGKHENAAGALTTPIYQTSTIEFDSVEQGGRRFAGQEAGYIYTRLSNPTVNAAEEKVAALEGGEAALGTAAGMGAICALGQLISGGYTELGLDKTDAGTATSITLVFLSAIATGLGLYTRLARFAGAGTLVPITGFANAVVSPAVDFKSEGLITGTAVKMFTIAGPVIAYGTAASVLYGAALMLLR